MARYLSTSVLFLLLLTACRRDEPEAQTIEDEKKIEIVSGNLQVDTIGHVLKDSVVLKATKNSLPLKFRSIESEAS
jgi:hypothetical protein